MDVAVISVTFSREGIVSGLQRRMSAKVWNMPCTEWKKGKKRT